MNFKTKIYAAIHNQKDRNLGATVRVWRHEYRERGRRDHEFELASMTESSKQRLLRLLNGCETWWDVDMLCWRAERNWSAAYQEYINRHERHHYPKTPHSFLMWEAGHLAWDRRWHELENKMGETDGRLSPTEKFQWRMLTEDLAY